MTATQTTEAITVQTNSSRSEWIEEALALERQTVVVAKSNASTPMPLAFIRLLAADAKLREQVEANPVEALALHGIHVDPSTLPANVTLPSQEVLVHLATSGDDSDNNLTFLRWIGFLGGLED